jgi:transportin-3
LLYQFWAFDLHVSVVVEDFFNLLRNMCHISPRIFMNSTIFPSTFHCALAGLSSEQPSALTAVLSFFDELYTAGQDVSNRSCIQPLAELIQAHGQTFLHLLLKGTLYHFPRDNLFEVTTTMSLFHNFFNFSQTTWVAEFLDQLPAGHITIEERNKFLVDTSRYGLHLGI